MQTQILHRLLEAEVLPVELALALVLGQGFSNVEAALLVLTNSSLCMSGILEAYEAKAFGLHVLIPHDDCGSDLSMLREDRQEVFL